MGPFLILLISVLSLSVGCYGGTERSGPVRILPLGDSITQADAGHASYRYRLWKKLRAAGHDIDFVGSVQENFRGANPAADFDHDHEGRWGWSAEQFVRGVPGQGGLKDFLAAYTPDIALVHIGSNDVFRGADTSSIITNVKAMISLLTHDNPDVVVLVAQLIPVASHEGTRRIHRLNRALAELPHDRDLQARVIVVDQFSGFDPAADTYDGIHPNEGGEEKMAEAWFTTLKKIL